MKQFRLISLKLKGHKYLGDLELNFCNTDDLNYSSLYNTIIIGPNGTGKSYILSIIVDLFRELYIIIKDEENGKRKGLVNGLFSLIYSINDIQYCYRNIPKSRGPKDFTEGGVPGGRNWREKKYFLEKNGINVSQNEIKIPERILASSMMLTDKFVFLSNQDEFPIYKYLGIRGTRSTAGTRTYIRNTVNALVNSIKNEFFNEKILDVLEFLELDNYFSLRYTVNRKDDIFVKELNVMSFHDFFQKYEDQWMNRKISEDKDIIPWYGYKHFKKIAKDEKLINDIVNFCKSKSDNELEDKNYFSYNILKDYKSLSDEYPIIYHLDKLNLIKFPELYFKKGEDIYNFEGTSSGEAHFISSIIGILSCIKENSLVLIDEPEISLHPNWQMKYMNFLNKAFAKYKSCHFIIATHSHFLISDLNGDNSKIIGLKRDENKIEIVDLPVDLNTYGWSAEEVLYTVFNVRSTRNSYLEYDLTKLVTLVNRNSKDYNEIKRILDKISTLILSDNDPLKILKEKAEKYLEQNYA